MWYKWPSLGSKPAEKIITGMKAKTKRNLVLISAIIHRDDEFSMEVKNLLKDLYSFNITACFNPTYHGDSEGIHWHFKGTIELANVFQHISVV